MLVRVSLTARHLDDYAISYKHIFEIYTYPKSRVFAVLVHKSIAARHADDDLI